MTLLGYTKDRRQIANIILSLASKKKQVVYGAQSVNAQLPEHLKRETKDYDILTKNPQKAAEELAEKLNKEYGNGFKAVKARYEKTYKVKDKYGNTIADYTLTTKKPNSKIILGVRYAELGYQKKKIGRILNDESNAFRWDKDLDTLKRIRAGETQIW